jgi:hypothetical protein
MRRRHMQVNLKQHLAGCFTSAFLDSGHTDLLRH